MSASRLKSVYAVSDSELKALIARMGGDGEDSIMGTIVGLKLNDDMWNNLDNVAKVVAYQGFDPKRMAGEVAAKLVLYNNQTLLDLKMEGETCKYTQESTTLDVSFLITLFLMRGNTVHKILSTVPAEVKDVITRKCANLGIMISKDVGKKLNSTSVTLARLSQAFPQVTATIIEGKKIVGKLNPKWLMGSAIPLIMQHSIFSAMIPSDDVATPELKKIATALNLEMTVMLQTPKDKRKMEGRDINDLEETSAKYVLAAINGTTCTAEVQRKILKKAGIVGSDGGLTPVCSLIYHACSKFLDMKELSYRDAVKAMIRDSTNRAAAAVPGPSAAEN